VKYTGIFFRTRNNLPQNIALQLYYAFVYSRIAYSIEVYGMAKPTVLEPLQIMQNRILKILTCKPKRFPTNTLYSSMDILKVNEIHKNKLYIVLYKYTQGKLPALFNHVLNPNANTVGITTRLNTLFTVSRFNSQHGKMLLNNYSSKMWQDLPLQIKHSNSLPIFKNKLKSYLLSEYT
jgi:hypothetical protein